MPEPPYKAVHLSELPLYHSPEGDDLGYEFRAVRRRLGVRSFGINAMVAASAGDAVVAEHAESTEGTLQEELYYVARGHAEFTVGGERVDAPEGTFVYVPDPATVRSALATAAGTVVIGIGGEPGAAFVPASWEDAWAGD